VIAWLGLVVAFLLPEEAPLYQIVRLPAGKSPGSETVSRARLDAKGGIVALSSIRAGREPEGIALGDLDGNGLPEVVVAVSGEDAVSILSGLPRVR
jgi:hypothetical protein